MATTKRFLDPATRVEIGHVLNDLDATRASIEEALEANHPAAVLPMLDRLRATLLEMGHAAAAKGERVYGAEPEATCPECGRPAWIARESSDSRCACGATYAGPEPEGSSDLRSCESCGRTVAADDEGAPALGMTDLYFCPPGYGCSSVDARGRDRVAHGRAVLGTHPDGPR